MMNVINYFNMMQMRKKWIFSPNMILKKLFEIVWTPSAKIFVIDLKVWKEKKNVEKRFPHGVFHSHRSSAAKVHISPVNEIANDMKREHRASTQVFDSRNGAQDLKMCWKGISNSWFRSCEKQKAIRQCEQMWSEKPDENKKWSRE